MTITAVQQQGADLVLNVHVQPNAARTEFCGLHGEAVKIRLHAPPVDGKANDELCRFLAQAFGVRPRSVVLLSGATTRVKRVRIMEAAVLPPFITKILQGVAL
jgi:hypothetical protein